jgi:hypothetical protein
MSLLKKKQYTKWPIALITDKRSDYFGRIGFSYSIYSNGKTGITNYSIYLLPDGKKIKLRDDLMNPKKFMQFKDLEKLSDYLAYESKFV